MDLGYAQTALATQPFSVLVGARVVEFGDGAATIEIDVRDELRQQNGYLHGGVLAYAADNVLTFAGGSVLGPSVITAGFTINYLRAARDGVLRAEGVVVHANSRQAVCTAELRVIAPDGGSVLCAVAQGTVVATRVRT